MIDMKGPIAQIIAVIKSFGAATPVAIVRSSFDQDTETTTSTSVFKGPCVFSSKTVTTDQSGAASFISKINIADGIAYIAGTSKNAPAPGDSVTGKGRTWKIKAVQAYEAMNQKAAYRLDLE